MRIVEAPGVYRSLPISNKNIIFLAGSIEMGSAENWQKEILEILYYSNLNLENTIVLNPRREDWDSTQEQSITNPQFREQVEWELIGIDDSSIVIFYFDPNTKSPITLMELGTMSKRPEKAIVCCPDGFWRKGNVEVFCEVMGIELLHSKEELFDSLKTMVWK